MSRVVQFCRSYGTKEFPVSFSCKSLICLVALVSAGTLTAQESLTQKEVASAATTASLAAWVYVQTSKGVNVYDAATSGQLTLVKGSPFADTGAMEGHNGKYLLVVGTDYLHSYAIGANGAVGAQVSQINTQSYSGSECGNTDSAGAILDHTGNFFYVQLQGASYNGGEDYTCAAWQTYKIGSNGAFTFLGANELGYGFDSTALSSTLPTFSSNDKFTYGEYFTAFAPVYAAFQRDSTGVLEQNANFTNNSPTPDPNPADSVNDYYPQATVADPNGHLAIAMVQSFSSLYPLPALQLASFTINSKGAITTTNTWANMPTLPWNPDKFTGMNMSPAGNLLAVSGLTGLQVYHFNGAAPITAYSSVLLPGVEVDELAWDKSNHLYALSYSHGLYVFTVTPTSISEVSGSPYKFASPTGVNGVKDLIVVPK